MLTSAVLAISTLDVVYLGQDQLLLHRPATGAYSLHQYARYARAPCAGLAPEPVYAGTVGVKNSRFASLGGASTNSRRLASYSVPVPEAVFHEGTFML